MPHSRRYLTDLLAGDIFIFFIFYSSRQISGIAFKINKSLYLSVEVFSTAVLTKDTEIRKQIL